MDTHLAISVSLATVLTAVLAASTISAVYAETTISSTTEEYDYRLSTFETTTEAINQGTTTTITPIEYTTDEYEYRLSTFETTAEAINQGTTTTITPIEYTTDDFDQCEPNPCHNGAVCESQSSDFLCRCLEGYRGRTCNQKVPLPPRVMRREVEIFPEQGPEAGGTNLTILLKSGIKEVHSVFLSLPQHEECSIIERTEKSLIARTPPYVANTKADLLLLITVNADKIIWNTGYTFSYKPNPGITNIQPNTTLVGGGTKLTVSGTSIDSVAHPMISFGVMHCFTIDQQAKFLEHCKVEGSDKMFCLTPNVTVCNATKSTCSGCNSNPSKLNHTSSENIKLLLSILGFILDGDTNYGNLSEHADLPSQLEAYNPPVLQNVESTMQYQKGVPLEIKGQHMDKGVTAGDYTVYVGKGTCLTTDQSLSGSKLLCIPPDPIPEKSNDFRSKYHNINVKIGNYYYDYGYMWYPWWLNKMIIIPVAVVGGLFVIVLLPALVIVKARQRKPKSDSQLDSAIVLPPVMTEDIEVPIEGNDVILSRKSARNRQTMDFPSYINVDREEAMEMK